jgi:hypothetical protein
MEIASVFLFPGLFLLLVLAFGLWLSGVGKPYNGILFNLHKLIALGGVIDTGWLLARFLGTAHASTLLIVSLVVAALAVLALFASGGLLSAGKLDYARLLTLHRIGPVVLVGALGTVVYLLAQG